MENENNYKALELLDKYLDGELDSSERSDLERRIREDETLRSDLEVLQIARDAIRTKALRDKVKKLHQTLLPEVREDEKKVIPINRNKKIFRVAMSVAASVIIVVASFVVYQYSTVSADKLYSQQFLSYELPVARSTGDEMTVIDSLYLSGNYAQVITYFNSLQQKGIRDYFLTAMSYLHTERFTDAINLFQYVVEKNNDQPAGEKYFEQETDFYLSLAYLKIGEFAKCKELFTKMKANPRHLYHKNVSRKDIWMLEILEKEEE